MATQTLPLLCKTPFIGMHIRVQSVQTDWEVKFYLEQCVCRTSSNMFHVQKPKSSILMPFWSQVLANSERFPRFGRITWRFQRVNLTLASVIEAFSEPAVRW